MVSTTPAAPSGGPTCLQATKRWADPAEHSAQRLRFHCVVVRRARAVDVDVINVGWVKIGDGQRGTDGLGESSRRERAVM
jgi:hypothetical protein